MVIVEEVALPSLVVVDRTWVLKAHMDFQFFSTRCRQLYYYRYFCAFSTHVLGKVNLSNSDSEFKTRPEARKKCIECCRRAGCDIVSVVKMLSSQSAAAVLDVDGVNVSEQLVEDTGTLPFEAKESLLSVTTMHTVAKSSNISEGSQKAFNTTILNFQYQP